MNSKNLEATLGLSAVCWKEWRSLNLALVPRETGVYVIKGEEGFARVKGISDIVYVGSGHLQDRLRAHRSPDWLSWKDSGWLIAFVASGQELQVAWQQTEKARLVESDLLQSYLKDHNELPPANRQLPVLSSETREHIILRSAYSMGPEEANQFSVFAKSAIARKQNPKN